MSQHVLSMWLVFQTKNLPTGKNKNKEKIINLKDVHKTIISGLIPRNYRNLRYTVIDKNTEIKNITYLC